MTIANAARATRKFQPYKATLDMGRKLYWFAGGSQPYMRKEEAQAACDRLNLVSVLEAIREPSLIMSCREILNILDRPGDLEALDRLWSCAVGVLIKEMRGGGQVA